MADIIKRNQRDGLSWPFNLFDDFFTPHGIFREGSFFTPALNVIEDETHYGISAELPGLTIDDIELSVEDDILILKGEKKFESDVKEKNYHRIECKYGSFQRSLRLPIGAKLSDIKAEFENGVLKIEIQKEEKKTQKIDIKAKKK